MKKLVLALVAGILLLGNASAQDAESHTLRVEIAKDLTPYLVDDEGKLVYWFLPFGVEPVPVKESWPEPSRTWASFWEPVTVSGPDELSLSDELEQNHIFRVVFQDRGTASKFQVLWGGSNTAREAFWPLYTYRYDLPLRFYSMRQGDVPAGMIGPLWEPALGRHDGAPAPVNARRLGLWGIGDPGGNTEDGGP